MNPDVKKLWLSALRSGDFPQGIGWLHQISPQEQHQFCCLGVLCELYVSSGQAPPLAIEYTPSDCGHLGYYSYDRHADLLPAPVVTWAGLPDDNPVVNEHLLSSWNDYIHLSFCQIADLIKESMPCQL